MTNQAHGEGSRKLINSAIRAFSLTLIAYAALLISAVVFSAKAFKGTTWAFFALVIGGVYVSLAFYYFYDNFLRPYIKELVTTPHVRRNVFPWVIEWVLPAIFVQFFIFVGFWMTVQQVPFQSYIYTNRYMFGMVYKKLDRLLTADMNSAGAERKLDTLKADAARERSIEKAKLLHLEFASHLK